VRALALQPAVGLLVGLDEQDLVAFLESMPDRGDGLVRVALGEHVVRKWRLVLLVLVLVGPGGEGGLHARLRAIQQRNFHRFIPSSKKFFRRSSCLRVKIIFIYRAFEPIVKYFLPADHFFWWAPSPRRTISSVGPLPPRASRASTRRDRRPSSAVSSRGRTNREFMGGVRAFYLKKTSVTTI
jgi:hypothetical protein